MATKERSIEEWWKQYAPSRIPMEESLRENIRDAFYAGAAVVYMMIIENGADGSVEREEFNAMLRTITEETKAMASSYEERLSKLPSLKS